MAKYYNSDFQFWVDDVELASHAKVITVNGSAVALDSTPLSTTGYVELLGGLKSAAIDAELMQNMAEGSVDDTLFPLLGAANTVKSLAIGSAAGSPAYVTRGVVFNYTPLQGNVGDIAGARLSAMSSGVVARGQMLIGSAARSSSSAGAEWELGALSASQRLYASLHVVAVTGSPTLDVIVQSDTTGFGSPTSRVTFSQATAKGSQWGSVSGAVTDTFWRASWTFGGTGSITFAVCAGIAAI